MPHNKVNIGVVNRWQMYITRNSQELESLSLGFEFSGERVDSYCFHVEVKAAKERRMAFEEEPEDFGPAFENYELQRVLAPHREIGTSLSLRICRQHGPCFLSSFSESY